MYRSRTVAFIILLSFIFNFAYMGDTPVFAEESDPPAPSTPKIETIFPNFAIKDEIISGKKKAISIVGENFNSDEIVNVTIGNILIENELDSINVSSDGKLLHFDIDCASEDFQAGIASVEVKFKQGGSLALDKAFVFFTSKDDAVASIEEPVPNTGIIEGGTEVSIKAGSETYFLLGPGPGAGIAKQPEVRFGDKSAEVIHYSLKELRVKAPIVEETGRVKVTVTNPSQAFSNETDFYYVAKGEQIRILSITPNRGTAAGGTIVEIRGVNFPTNLTKAPDGGPVVPPAKGQGYEELSVSIGDIKVAKIYDIVEDQNTPPGQDGKKVYIIKAETASSGDFGLQDVQVDVTWDGTKNNRREIAILEKGFNYYEPETNPKITEVKNMFNLSNEGPIKGGHSMQIKGSGFVTPVKVYFGSAEVIGEISVNVDPEQENGQILTFKLPPLSSADAIGPVDVRVENIGSGSIATGEYTLPGGFTYRKASVRLAAITPDSSFENEGGAMVEITGIHFDEDDDIKISFGRWEQEKDKDITEVDAAHPDNFIITQIGEASFVQREPLTDIQILTNSKITAYTPNKLTAGTIDLIIENSYGIVILRDAFEIHRYDVEPIIETVVAAVYEGDIPPSPRGPTSGRTPFVIYGENFQARSEVYVGGMEPDNRAFNVKVDIGRITADSPPGNPGWQDVYIISPFGKIGQMKAAPVGERPATEGERVGKQGFHYDSNPKIIDVNPNIGSTEGGNIIAITGEQFYSDATVSFGFQKDDGEFETVTETVSEIEIDTETNKTIKLRLPKLLESELSEDQLNKLDQDGKLEVQVQVLNTDGETATWEPFILKKPVPQPEIISVSPVISKTIGGTQVVIQGKNFKNPIVYFGWDEAKIISSTETQIVLRTPPKEAGKYKLTVSNREDGAVVIWDKDFLYLDGDKIRPIQSIVPNKGPLAGGTTITITGEDFDANAEVWIDGKLAKDIKANFTYISAKTPEAAQVGAVDVMVVNSDGTIYLMEKGFTYENPEENPKIVSVTPEEIPTTGNIIVKVAGEGFQQGIKVYIGSNQAQIVRFEEPNVIMVKAPAHPLGVPDTVPLTVINPDGGVAQWDELKYVLPQSQPRITNVVPNKGPASGGNKVTIDGEGFRQEIAVYFGGRLVEEVLSARYNNLEVIAPLGEPGKPVDITVTNTASDALGSATFEKAYTYVASKPSITSVAPNQGSYLGGTLVTIKGQDFTTVGAVVYIGEWEGLNVKVIDPETITLTTPRIAGKPGELPELKLWDVKVINADGVETVKDKAFRYLYPESNPRISSFDPKEGPTTGGLPVTIKGSDFRQQAKVVIGGKDALEVRVIDENTIIAVIPPHNVDIAGKEVVVINYDGAIAIAEDKFIYRTPLSFPEIIAIDPKQGPTSGNTEVTITGIGFKEDARIWFGLYEATKVEFIDYQTLKVITPSGRQGNVDLLVLNPDMGQAVLANAFRYVPSNPRVDSIVPTEGSYKGGTVVNITGQDFSNDVDVFIGKWKAEVVRGQSQSDRIQIITPSIDVENIGWHDVRIVNGDGIEIVVAEGYRYLYPESKPEIKEMNPQEGSIAGGLPLTIVGTDFRERAKVIIGGKEAQVVYIDDSSGEGKAIIKAIIPPHTEGPKKVVVINYDGAESKEDKGKEFYFVYKKPLSFPEIHAVDPQEGLTIGYTEVTITGIGFKKEDAEGSYKLPRVWFGINEAQKVEFIDYKTLRVITPFGNEGMANVLVLNPDMGQDILPNAFLYIEPEGITINAITPSRGLAKGGTLVTINGGPFQEGTTVEFGGKPGLDVTLVDVRTITVVNPPWELDMIPEQTVDVTVTNPDGMQTSLPSGFTYYKTAPEHPPEWVDTGRKDRETIEITWQPVEFANYYEIWVSKTRNGKYRFLDQTTKAAYYATTLDYNETYYFQIRAVNELGVSDFSYYNYARTGSGREKSADLVPTEIVIETTNGNAIATIANANALAGTGYRVDFTSSTYQSANRKGVRISQEALTKSYLPLTIDAPGISLSIPVGSLYLGLIGQKNAYAEVWLLDLGQQAAERALRELPRGSRIISPVYGLEWQILNGAKGTPQTTFHQQVNLTMKYSTAIAPGKQVSLYTYNPSTGKWVNTGAANDPYAPQLSLGINDIGRFMLVEH